MSKWSEIDARCWRYPTSTRTVGQTGLGLDAVGATFGKTDRVSEHRGERDARGVDYIRERESASRRSGYGVSWAAGGVLTAAYAAHPERFPAGLPHPPTLPAEVWINPPKALGRSQASSNTQLLADKGAFA